MLLQCLSGISQKDIIYGSSYQSFCKKGVFKNFAKFTGKYLCQSLFLHKNAGLPQTCNFFKKEALAQVFSCEFCKVFRNNFFYRTTPVAASVNNTPSALHICFPGKVSQDGSELVVWCCSAK